mgnify:CR=1 FL=1
MLETVRQHVEVEATNVMTHDDVRVHAVQSSGEHVQQGAFIGQRHDGSSGSGIVRHLAFEINWNGFRSGRWRTDE